MIRYCVKDALFVVSTACCNHSLTVTTMNDRAQQSHDSEKQETQIGCFMIGPREVKCKNIYTLAQLTGFGRVVSSIIEINACQ